VAIAPTEPQTAGGAMPLMDHLRELRTRIFKSILAISVGAVVGWILYDPIFAVITEPIVSLADAQRTAGLNIELVLSGVTQAFMLQLKVALLAGFIISSPIWLYQFWAFITPGLHKHERRYALGFLFAAVPLFLLGAALALWVLPKGLSILIGFTPQDVSNFISVDTYLSFLIRLVIVFGVGFLTPVVIVALNFMGVLSGAGLLRTWRWTILGVFIFAAAATPTPDPFTMLLLALPILLLISGAFLIALLNDRRRARKSGEPDYGELSDDEASPIGGAGGLGSVSPIESPAPVDADDFEHRDRDDGEPNS
jgi:sec-independent protein translocase protein TatC